MSIKAIETSYQGYRFRSRLEARWAVFLDALGVRFEYEREGYELGDEGRYLPDFWLPDVFGGLWVEIKPGSPTAKEIRNMELLTDHTGHFGIFRTADPATHVLYAIGVNSAGGSTSAINDDDLALVGEGMAHYDACYLFCECPWCGKVGVAFEGRGEKVCGWPSHYETEKEAALALHRTHGRANRCFTGDSYRMIQAAKESRSARFEHGEQPRYSAWR